MPTATSSPGHLIDLLLQKAIQAAIELESVNFSHMPEVLVVRWRLGNLRFERAISHRDMVRHSCASEHWARAMTAEARAYLKEEFAERRHDPEGSKMRGMFGLVRTNDQ